MNQSEIQKTNAMQPIEGSKASKELAATNSIAEKLKRIYRKLPETAYTYDPGAQVLVQGPEVTVAKGEEMKQEVPIISEVAKQKEPATYEVTKSSTLGVLNILGLGTNSVTFEYISISGGKNFEIVFNPTDGTHTITGISEEEVNDLLNTLFNADGTMNTEDRSRIRSGSQRNLAYFDRFANDLKPTKKLGNPLRISDTNQ